jgi:sRNA-binding carbon storage regulator CsrA
MLVWTRKTQEPVIIGGPGAPEPMVTRTVLGINCGKVRVRFPSDAAVGVHRGEYGNGSVSMAGRTARAPDPAWPDEGQASRKRRRRAKQGILREGTPPDRTHRRGAGRN